MTRGGLRNALALAGVVSLAGFVSLAGCSAFQAPLGSPSSSTTRADPNIALAQTSHEYPSPQPPAQTVSGRSASAVAAVTAFALVYINWTASTVSGHMRALAAASVGQARSAMQLAAAQTANDYELKRGGISNRGTVEAIAPLSGHRNEYVVVTREQTSATNTDAYQGLRPAWHLAIATVTQVAPGTWALSNWQPEN